VCRARPMRAHGAPNAAYSRQIMSQNHRCATPAIDPMKKPSLFEVPFSFQSKNAALGGNLKPMAAKGWWRPAAKLEESFRGRPPSHPTAGSLRRAGSGHAYQRPPAHRRGLQNLACPACRYMLRSRRRFARPRVLTPKSGSLRVQVPETGTRSPVGGNDGTARCKLISRERRWRALLPTSRRSTR
jgi:hypothetical protein